MYVDTSYSTKEEIRICAQRPNGKLVVEDVKKLPTYLATDESGQLATVAKYKGKFYQINGNCFFGYIVA